MLKRNRTFKAAVRENFLELATLRKLKILPCIQGFYGKELLKLWLLPCNFFVCLWNIWCCRDIRKYSTLKVAWRIPKSILNGYKKHLLLEIDNIKKFLLLRMTHITGGGSLFDDWYIWLLYYPNAWIAWIKFSFSYYSVCFLISSEICKQYREY